MANVWLCMICRKLADGSTGDIGGYKKARVVIPVYHNYSMPRIIKPDAAPGEFKCRVCEMRWSNFMENSIRCTDTTIIRNGLHDFDFANPILVLAK